MHYTVKNHSRLTAVIVHVDITPPSYSHITPPSYSHIIDDQLLHVERKYRSGRILRKLVGVEKSRQILRSGSKIKVSSEKQGES